MRGKITHFSLWQMGTSNNWLKSVCDTQYMLIILKPLIFAIIRIWDVVNTLNLGFDSPQLFWSFNIPKISNYLQSTYVCMYSVHI